MPPNAEDPAAFGRYVLPTDRVDHPRLIQGPMFLQSLAESAVTFQFPPFTANSCFPPEQVKGVILLLYGEQPLIVYTVKHFLPVWLIVVCLIHVCRAVRCECLKGRRYDIRDLVLGSKTCCEVGFVVLTKSNRRSVFKHRCG